MSKAMTTIIAKKKMLLARAGKQDLPPVAQMVFGTGGINSSGGVLEIQPEQDSLRNEVLRKDIENIEIINDTKIRYSCTLGEHELAGENISEIALADSEGDLLTIKNFAAKGKDDDFTFRFMIDDTM